MDAKTAGNLIGKGILFGILHVLSGPDHLSAIAALSANTSYVHSISYGMRWGVGHSLGLFVVTVIFLSVGEQAMDLDKVGSAFEWLVGVMMILLGLFTGWRAVHSEYYQKGDAADNDSPLPPPPTAGTPLLPPQSSSSSSSGGGGEEKTAAGAGDVEAGGAAAVNASGSGSSKAATWLRGLKERALALVVGCVHGVAGPGGVLGVLPAVELHAWGPAMTYLFSFCITSILVMGAFAGLWGEMSYRLGVHWRERKVAFGFQIFSACLSLIVGVLWIVLKSLGLLEQVFG